MVTQYGPKPHTTFDPATLAAQSNIHVTLDLPKGIQASQILLLPLSEGVLWGIVPAQSSTSAPADSPSQLFYTTYGGTNPSNVTLSENTDTLGEIPVTTTSLQMSTSWYKPQFTTNAPNTGNQTNGPMLVTPGNAANSTQNSPGDNTTNTANTSIATPTSAPENQPVIRTISDVTGGGVNLILKSLYKVDGGAVIVVRTQQSDTSGEWAVLWNEVNKTLTPICSIHNSASDFGWLAVGQHTVYWAERSLIAPADMYYRGSQHMMTLATGVTRTIRLGTWTTEAVAGQNLHTYRSDPDQADDELYFRVNNTQVWKEFLPSK